MANGPNRKISIPKEIRAGEPFEVKSLIMHPMENGFRLETDGSVIPVHIIDSFVATLDGEEVFRAEWFPSIAANPFFSFYTVANASGTLELTWHDDDGSIYTETVAVTVQ